MEPTSTTKAERAIKALPFVDLVTPDFEEFKVLMNCNAPSVTMNNEAGEVLAVVNAGLRAAAAERLHCNFIIKLGRYGLCLPKSLVNPATFSRRLRDTQASVDDYVLIASPRAPSVVSVTGAGDSFVGGFLAGVCAGAPDTPSAVTVGLQAAAMSLQSVHAVSPDLPEFAEALVYD